MRALQKICIITPTLRGGGAEKVALNLANYYSTKGYIVDLVTFQSIGPYQSLVDKNVALVNLKSNRTLQLFSRLRLYFRQNLDSLIISTVRDSNAIVGLSALFLPITLVFSEQNTLDAIYRLPLIKRFVYFLQLKLSYSKSALVIANSEDTRADLCDAGVISFSKSVVISNPVLPPNYLQLADEDIDVLWLKDNQFKTILSVGRLTEQKNYTFLIDVFQEVHRSFQNARLVIIGEGEQHSLLLQLIQKYGLSEYVLILDFKINIFPYYKHADVFALTSKWEGFGNVLVEALSVGLPVISTNCPGGPKMILEDGYYGTLIPVGCKESYVNSLLNHLNNSIKDPNLIRYAQNFTVEAIAEEYLRVSARFFYRDH